MASNLLGLPAGRLGRNPDAALALYGEGMRWLARFCQRLGDGGRRIHPPVEVAEPGDVEPASIRGAREAVKARVPGARETFDRRGFRLLQWESPRGNEDGKPYELSLEHEARLTPSSEAGLAELQRALGLSDGRAVGEFLLPGDETHRGLRVTRDPRESGPQSIDRYWELDAVPRQRLIPRMLSLIIGKVGGSSPPCYYNEGPATDLRRGAHYVRTPALADAATTRRCSSRRRSRPAWCRGGRDSWCSPES